MTYGATLQLASIEAIRPVFMIVMGVFLMVIAWRLCKATEGWTARLIVAYASLGFGYAVMLPLYDAGLLPRFSSNGSSASALAWHAVKIVVMNCGWLLSHGSRAARPTFSPSPPPPELSPSPLTPPREFIA